jgi:DNA-binding NarL/FixJ family response regulator
MEPETVIRVLVVDDHEVVRRGLHAFLDGEPDLEVVADAGGGEEALDVCERLDSEGRAPDVVLMDLQMSPMDGIETTRRVRDRYPGVEVVALTSFAEKERVRAALESGASGYLLKDSEAAEVAAAVRSAHRGEIQLTRELEVLRLVGAGKANKEIAAELVISERTARTHVSNVLRKIGVSSRTQAAVLAVREGLVAPPEREGARPA